MLNKADYYVRKIKDGNITEQDLRTLSQACNDKRRCSQEDVIELAVKIASKLSEEKLCQITLLLIKFDKPIKARAGAFWRNNEISKYLVAYIIVNYPQNDGVKVLHPYVKDFIMEHKLVSYFNENCLSLHNLLKFSLKSAVEKINKANNEFYVPSENELREFFGEVNV